jgi:hypothetical protein
MYDVYDHLIAKLEDDYRWVDIVYQMSIVVVLILG